MSWNWFSVQRKPVGDHPGIKVNSYKKLMLELLDIVFYLEGEFFKELIKWFNKQEKKYSFFYFAARCSWTTG
jgi:hypothetical protein